MRPNVAQRQDLTVSVVVCAYTMERWDMMQAAIASVLSQTRVPLEVILVIDHNPVLFERSKRALASCVRVLENDLQQGCGGARNVGIRACTGDVVAFLDDDAVASATWIERLLSAYEDGNVLGVGGLLVPGWRETKPAWFPDEFLWVVGCSYRGLPSKRGEVRNLITANMSLRMDALAIVGGFRPGLERVGNRPFGVEETELCIRIRHSHPTGRLLHEPAAVAIHYVSKDRERFSYFIRLCFNEGLGKAMMGSLVGTRESLSSEFAYTTLVLPKAIFANVAKGLRCRRIAPLAESGAIAAGLGAATLGYIRGRLQGQLKLAEPAPWVVRVRGEETAS